MVRYVDERDSNGHSWDWLIPDCSVDQHETLEQVGLDAVLRAIKVQDYNGRSKGDNDESGIFQKMYYIFEGLLENARKHVQAIKTAMSLPLYGRVLYVDNKGPQVTMEALRRREAEGVCCAVFVSYNSVGIVRPDHSEILTLNDFTKAVIETAGESVGNEPGCWFAHESGYLLACGTSKARALSSSEVKPMDLVEAMNRYLDTLLGTTSKV